MDVFKEFLERKNNEKLEKEILMSKFDDFHNEISALIVDLLSKYKYLGLCFSHDNENTKQITFQNISVKINNHFQSNLINQYFEKNISGIVKLTNNNDGWYEDENYYNEKISSEDIFISNENNEKIIVMKDKKIPFTEDSLKECLMKVFH